MDIISWFEMLGIGAFALSGAQVAIARKMDIFGVFVLGAITALGGGILRDGLVLNITPVCLHQPWAWAIVTSVCLLTSLWRRSLPVMLWVFWDALGLGAFVVGIGAQLYVQQHSMGVFFMGSLLTGIGGGMLRDILAQRIPVILRKDIYALAGLSGALVLWVMLSIGLSEILAMMISLSLVVGIRMISVKYQLHIPVPGGREQETDQTASFPPVRRK